MTKVTGAGVGVGGMGVAVGGTAGLVGTGVGVAAGAQALANMLTTIISARIGKSFLYILASL